MGRSAPCRANELAWKPRFRHLALAAASLIALSADPARAQCSTSTVNGVTTLTCANTVTTGGTNTNENNPSTSARAHRYAPTINVNIGQGVTVSGLGLLVWPTGGNPLTIVNNGTVSHTAGETANGQPVDGLSIIGNGGLVTYLGNGSATSNATPPQLASGLSITNTNGGGINIGSQAAPITGATFSGESGLVARSPSGGFINAWFNGGTFTGTNPGNDALELSGLGDVTLVMTGQSVLNGSLNVGVYSNAPPGSVISATTDARITATLGIAMFVSGVSGETNATLTSGASITGQAGGIAMFSDGGVMRLTTAAGTTVVADGANAGSLGVQFQPGGAGSVVADLSGSITAGGAGIFLRPADGSIDITIREGAIVSGGEVGFTVVRFAGEDGVIDILNLGTLSSPNTAADFDGTLRIGDGGTSGTISGNVANGGSLIFNRSDASTYAGSISGAGTLTKLGPGTLTLTGASSYTGATSVNAGTLLVEGSLLSPTTVAAGALLGGAGSVGNVAMNGELAPGGEGVIGTLTVNGSLAFGPDSNFIVDASNSAADRLNVAGATSLNGTITVVPNEDFLVPVNGFYPERFYTVIESAGPLTGTFQGDTVVDGNFDPFGIIRPTVRYEYQSDGFTVGRVILFLEVPGIFETFSSSVTETVTRETQTVRVDTFSTRILGRLTGGTSLFDQSYALPFADPQVQAGVDLARLAITDAGGPGVVIDGPTRIERTEAQVSSTTSTARTVRSETVSITVQELVGPVTVPLLDRGVCQTGGSNFQGQATPGQVGGLPTGCERGTDLFVPENYLLININTNSDRDILELTTTTNTFLVSETYELTGTVTAIGTVHAAVQSGLYDLASRFLSRLGGEGSPGLFGEMGPGSPGASALAPDGGGGRGWGEAYAFRNRGDARGGIAAERRDAWGFAGGFSLGLGPSIRLGFGVDHGRLDLEVPGAGESADVELTQIAASARFGDGPFSLALAAVYGLGSVDSVRTLLGGTAAGAYDVDLWGFVAEASYRFEAGAWRIVPRLALDHVAIESDAFTETGAFGLAAASNDRDRTRGSVGLEVGRSFATGADSRIDLAAWGRYVAILGGEERSLPVAFSLAPTTPLTMRGLEERDSVALGAQLGIQLSPSVGLYLAYDGRLASGYDAHGGTAGLRVRW